MRIGAIEAGGTKFVCGIGNEKGEIFEKVIYPTETPEITLKKVCNFFQNKKIDKLGVGAFGPIDLNPNSKTYGYIKKTPKLEWIDFDIIGYLEKELKIPIFFDTDVNAATLGEATWGIAKGIKNCVYITVGTGIGGGALVNGKLVHGMLHPEMGHIIIKRHPKDTYKGKCPFHSDCFEGLASGPSLKERWGKEGKNISEEHIAWDIEAFYIAQGIVNFILTLSPEKIILGGGVMKQSQLFPKIRREVVLLLKDYLQTNEILIDMDNYILAPKLGENAGLLGALALTL